MKIDFFSSIVILIFLSLSFDSYGASSSLKASGSETSDQQNTAEGQKKKMRKISANWDGSACTLPNHSVYLTDESFVYYHSSTPIAGFQNTVLGFSLEGNTISGCGTMVMLETEGKATGMSNLVISNANGESIPFVIVF